MDFHKNKTAFNLSDINNIDDFHSFSDYFENKLQSRSFRNFLIGPNVIHLRNPKKMESNENHNINNDHYKKRSAELIYSSKLSDVKSNKRNDEHLTLTNSLCRIILNNAQVKKEQTVLLNSCSNFSSKGFLKKLLKELDFIAEEQIKQDNSNKEEKLNSEFNQQLLRSLLFIDFFSIFTSLKTNKNDEIPISDYLIDFYSVDDYLKFGSLTSFQLNTNFIFNRGPEINNLNIFYMMIYNLSQEELFDNLYCDQTKDFFSIFDPALQLEEFIKRYIFAAQFTFLRNSQQFEMFANAKNNITLIKKEYEFYKNLYESYLSTKEYLGIDYDNEKKIFEVFYAILLLSEFDPFRNTLILNLIKKFNNENDGVNPSEALNFISAYFKSEENSKFSNTANKRAFEEDISIIKKLAAHLDLTLEKIIFLMLVEIEGEKAYIINENNASFLRSRNNFIKIIYLVFIDKIENLFKLVENRELNKITIYIAHSNLVHNDTFMGPYKNENKNFFVDKYVKETIIANYIQEIKNFSILQNSIKISVLESEENFPSINANEKYLAGVFNGQDFNFFKILEIYENDEFGLLRLSKDASLINSFKIHFSNKFSEKNEVQNESTMPNQVPTNKNNFVEVIDNNYVRIKHTFGVFYYDLSELVKEIQFTTKANFVAESYYRFIGYKINDLSYEIRCINNLDFSALSNFTCEIIYINYLMRIDTYKIKAILEDFKLFTVYYFYSRFFNFVFNVNMLREIIRSDQKFQPVYHYLNVDDFTFFKKSFAKKINISQIDYVYNRGFVLLKNSYNQILDENKHLASIIYKYDLETFLVLMSKKILEPNFSKLKHVIKSVRSYLKFTKIYHEKKVFRIIKNCILDLIIDNYPAIPVGELDEFPEFKFSFENDSVSTILPKLHANLNQLKKNWKNYLDDVLYLEFNKTKFANILNMEETIKERLINFQMLIFLFSKKYVFTNVEIIRKNGVLHYEFTKSILAEVLNLFSKHYNDMKNYLLEHNLKFQDKNLINIGILITKRLSIKDQQRKLSIILAEKVENVNNHLENTNNFGTQEKLMNNIFTPNKGDNFSYTASKDNNFSFGLDKKYSLNYNNSNSLNNGVYGYNNSNSLNNMINNLEINSHDFTIINDSGTKVNLNLLNSKFHIINNTTEFSLIQKQENKKRFTQLMTLQENLIIGANNEDLVNRNITNSNEKNILNSKDLNHGKSNNFDMRNSNIDPNNISDNINYNLIANIRNINVSNPNTLSVNNNSNINIHIQNTNSVLLTEERKEILFTAASKESLSPNLNSGNSRRKINAQKYVNDGIIDKILAGNSTSTRKDNSNINDSIKNSNDTSIKNFSGINKSNENPSIPNNKDMNNHAYEIKNKVNDVYIEAFNMNESNFVNNFINNINNTQKITEASFMKTLKVLNNEEIVIIKKPNQELRSGGGSLISKRPSNLSSNIDENDEIFSNKYIEFINSEGEPINSNNRSSLLNNNSSKRESKSEDFSVGNTNQNSFLNRNSKLYNNNIPNYPLPKQSSDIINRYDVKYLKPEMIYSIFYNPENNKATDYNHASNHDFFDITNKYPNTFYGIKDINSKDYYVKPRLSNKKNINAFINNSNADNSFSCYNNSKTNTEANQNNLNNNIMDMNMSLQNLGNLNINNLEDNSINRARKSLRSHSVIQTYEPDFKNYTIERSINILILDKGRYLSNKGINKDSQLLSSQTKSIQNDNDFKKYRKESGRKSLSDLSFEKENDFSLLANSVNSNLKKSGNMGNINKFNDNNSNQNSLNEFNSKNANSQLINLVQIKVLDEHLDLLKKKMSALEMWKTVNESSGKLCLGDIGMENVFTLEDSNENTEFFDEIMSQLNIAENLLKSNKIV